MAQNSVANEPPQVGQCSSGWAIVVRGLLLIGAVIVIDYLFLRSGGWAAAWGWSWSVSMLVAVVFSVVMSWVVLRVAFSQRPVDPTKHQQQRPPTDPQEYEAHGLGPMPADAAGRDLYLDMVKRTVANIIYEDPPSWIHAEDNEPTLPGGFSLTHRVRGEDSPTAAHSMIGLKRLANIQHCIEKVLAGNVPGDIIETGVFRGGAAIFMRAVLKAHGVTDRRVFAADTFVPPAPPRPNWFIVPILQALASIPSLRWQKRLLKWLQSARVKNRAFPKVRRPSDTLVQFAMWHFRNPVLMSQPGQTSLQHVRSSFARYGLLDEQVVFLEGFFADTLPDAPIDKLAVMRLDGDTYESTLDGLNNLYHKLSLGGYCIIDDYIAFPDCKRAVDAFREKHNITAPLQEIDHVAVYWQKQ